MTYHLTANGPTPCKDKVQECPYGQEHFSNQAVAEEIYNTRARFKGREPNAQDRIFVAYKFDR